MFARSIAVLFAAFAVTLAVGCQSNSAPASMASAPPTKAVIASTGNGTTTIFLPAGTGVQTLSTGSAPTCAQCAADAAAYFQSGTLAAKCPQCGATRTAAIGYQ